MDPVILAADLGGSSFRAALVDARGAIQAMASRQRSTALDAAGRSEEPAGPWFDAFAALAGELAHDPAFAAIAAVAITGMTRTQVVVDAAGAARGPAILFRDARSGAEADELQGLIDAAPARATYGPMNGFHPLARWLWLARHAPARLAEAAAILQPKDYLALRLTGIAAGDPISSAGFHARDGSGTAAALMAAAGLDARLLPRFVAPGQLVGRVGAAVPPPLARLAGLPVVMASMDTWCAALATGAVAEGAAYIVSGTTDVYGQIGRQAGEAPGLVRLPWGEGLVHVGGPGQAGADCLAWLGETMPEVWPGGDLDAALGRAARDAEPVLFLPSLEGERVPLWDPDMRGAFLGLNRRHRGVDFLWAVLEGVAYANRQVAELAATASGGRPDAVRLSGGAAASDAWCRIRADVLGLPVLRFAGTEAGLVGAAMLGLVHLGVFADLAAAQAAIARPDRRFVPDPERHARHDQGYRRFLALQAAARELRRGSRG